MSASRAAETRLGDTQSHGPRRRAELVVVMPLKDWSCASCGTTGAFLTMDDAGPLCLTCADMDHLVFLPAGDAALTRRAKRRVGFPRSWCALAARAGAMSAKAFSWRSRRSIRPKPSVVLMPS
jgi:hypothetical protein